MVSSGRDRKRKEKKREWWIKRNGWKRSGKCVTGSCSLFTMEKLVRIRWPYFVVYDTTIYGRNSGAK